MGMSIIRLYLCVSDMREREVGNGLNNAIMSRCDSFRFEKIAREKVKAIRIRESCTTLASSDRGLDWGDTSTDSSSNLVINISEEEFRRGRPTGNP